MAFSSRYHQDHGKRLALKIPFTLSNFLAGKCFTQRLIFLLTLLLAMVYCHQSIAATSQKRILLLNSYHQRMPWVADIVKGVEDVLQPEKNNYTLYIENMDSKEFHSGNYFDSLVNLLAVKYKDIELDLIFSSDNNAYDFLRENRDEVFPGVPVVFCGVNDFHQSHLAGLDKFTGVAEVFSAEETIKLALLLQPGIQRVYVINDYLKTGRLWAKDISTSLAQLASDKNLTIEHSPNLPVDELLRNVAEFDTNTIVLLGAYFSDSRNQPFRYEQIAELLSDAASVPVYSLVEFVIDEGLMGGHVISGYYQGYSMAQIGLNVLIGTAPQVLPVQMEGSNKAIINFEQLKRFNLDESNLPLNIAIINKPFSFYNHYKTEIFIVLGFIAILLGVILALVMNTIRLRRTRAALRGSEEEFRQLANATWEAVAIHDNGILLQVNELFTEMFGFTATELKGKPFLKYILIQESIDQAEQRFEANDLSLYEAVAKRKDGTLFPIEVRVRSIIYKGVNTRVAAIRDISERKAMEEKLAHSQKMEAIGTLAGGIAHDFNNILSAIIGYSELTLLKQSKDSNTYSNISKILKAGNRAKALVQQILTFANKSEQTQEPVQIVTIIEEALKLLRPSMPTSIEIRTALESDAYVLGDPNKIHQVIINLGTNAGKAMQTGGLLSISVVDIKLDDKAVSAHPEIDAGHFLKLSVQDTGIGIPEEIQPRIFDPFFTTREKADGTGLGLSVVLGIVQETGGFIDLKSGDGKGSTFDVYLPVLSDPEAVDQKEEGEWFQGTETIMLIDDEADVIEIGQKALATMGYTVKGYTDCQEAVEVFDSNPEAIDLVITDMTMPIMGGDELAARLLKIRPDIPIIVCTGYSESFTEKEAAMMGIKKFLFKPTGIATLTKAVHEVLNPPS